MRIRDEYRGNSSKIKITNLAGVPEIGSSKLKYLNDAGITTIEELLRCDVREKVKCKGLGISSLNGWIQTIKEYIRNN